MRLSYDVALLGTSEDIEDEFFQFDPIDFRRFIQPFSIQTDRWNFLLGDMVNQLSFVVSRLKKQRSQDRSLRLKLIVLQANILKKIQSKEMVADISGVE